MKLFPNFSPHPAAEHIPLFPELPMLIANQLQPELQCAMVKDLNIAHMTASSRKPWGIDFNYNGRNKSFA